MKDCVGQEIKKGSCIVYPGRSGSCLYLNHGIVDEIVQEGDGTYQNPSKIRVLIKSSVYDWKTGITTNSIRKVGLQRCDRITVVPDSVKDTCDKFPKV